MLNENNYASMVKNVLTLRYNPSLETSNGKIGWQSFEVKEYPNYLEHIENVIINYIKNELSSEKHVSVALSGGVDSTLVIALLRKALPDVSIEAISVRFADSVDETDLATKIAAKFDANHHIIPIENFLENLPKAISIIKMPFWDTHWYHVGKTAKKFSNSLVSGDGGDELFGGYTFRYEKFVSRMKSQMTPKEKTKLYLECHERDWVPDQENLFGKRAQFSWDEIYSFIIPYFDNTLPTINQIFLADINGKLLFNWIPLNRSFHEFFDLKAVTPILSKELLSFAPHLNFELKYDQKNNVGKLPLRAILKKYVDPSLINPKKQGFSVNTVNLWKSHGKKLCKHYLYDARIVKDGWINMDWIQKHFKNLDDDLNVRYVNKFHGLLAFEIWYRLFITKEMDPNTELSV
ncbi:MAG: asparagine synthase C-terminal domain-containing protein [Nitrosopumilaceae archaeon]